MKVTPLEIREILKIEPQVFGDSRGFFLETYSKERYSEAGISKQFVQDNLSRSVKGTLRGLHFQNPFGQGKLVQVLFGTVFDVAVDVRIGSPTFGQWVGETLSGENNCQLYIPPGFAHGFCVTSEFALFCYKCTEFYHPETELGILWNDSDLAIPWPVERPIVSQKDQLFQGLAHIQRKQLPTYASTLQSLA